MPRRILRVRCLVLVLLAGALLTECSSHHEAALDARVRAAVRAQVKQAKADHAPLAAAAMADGVVTDKEYRKLFSLFEECMATHGVPLLDTMVSPIDGRQILWDIGRSFRIPIERVNPTVQHCQFTTLSAAPIGVQEQPGPMDGRLRQLTVTCLERKGKMIPDSAKNLRQIVEAAAGDQAVSPTGSDPVSMCTSASFFRLHPDFKGSLMYTPPSTY